MDFFPLSHNELHNLNDYMARRGLTDADIISVTAAEAGGFVVFHKSQPEGPRAR